MRDRPAHRFLIAGMAAAMVSDGPLVLDPPSRIWPALPADSLPAGMAQDEPLIVEQNSLLLRAGDTLALFDVGMGGSKLFGPHSGRLLAGLAAAGVQAGEIGAVVLTHAHSDHCWGAVADSGEPAFPNAEILLTAPELEYWDAHPANRRQPDGTRRLLRPLRSRIRLIADGEEVLPGVVARAAIGHSAGHMIYRIGAGPGRAVLTGDCLLDADISLRRPDIPTAYDADGPLASRTRRSVLTALADQGVRALAYHLPWPGIGHVGRVGDAFVWVPEA